MSINIQRIKKKFTDISGSVISCEDFSNMFQLVVERISMGSKQDCETISSMEILPYYPLIISSIYEYNKNKQESLFAGHYAKPD